MKTNKYKIYATKLCIMLDFIWCAFCDNIKGITWKYNNEKRIGFNPKSANWGKIGNNKYYTRQNIWINKRLQY